MTYKITYNQRAYFEDRPKLSKSVREQIGKAVQGKLSTRPHYYGKPLRDALKGYWKLRVGSYRVIFQIQETIVEVLMIRHRSKIYQEAVKRLIKKL